MANFPIPLVAADPAAALPAIASDASASPWAGRRDTRRPVLLIGFLHQGNLGLGYLSATLKQFGYRVEVLDFEEDTASLVAKALALQPMLVGFSLIFQFYVRRFDALAQALRDAGLDCHFTIGGHFASLSSEETLRLVGAVDSVVRYEGELTLLELADRLGAGLAWRDVPGLAWRDGDGATRLSPARHLIHDLDSLPWPDRDYEFETILGQRMAPLIASRGCSRTCSFCSIHVFYRNAPGKVVRLRQPRHVVAEMHHLHHERGVNIFLFQDDDFPVYGKVWRRWSRELIDELKKADLVGRILFKLNCRADAVEPELFGELRDAGLFIVYMGLESGSEEGLETLNKGLEVQQNLDAVRLLKEIGLTFEFGFMLFDPSSSFKSIRENLGFLRTICANGAAAAVFCRMLPYDGTPIKTQLALEGRLRGDVVSPDYDFLDLRINALFEDLNHLVHVAGWIHGHRALSPKLNWAWIELAVVDRLFPSVSGRAGYERQLRAITKASNELLFRLVDDLVDSHQAGRTHRWSEDRLAGPCDALLKRLAAARDGFVERNRGVLLGRLQQQGLVAAA
jgi:anaerobic magnesium-protoporphyrin IX monomethyl ester cyclase